MRLTWPLASPGRLSERIRAGIGRVARRSGSRLSGARHRLDGATGVIALTFDDGPDPQSTPWVLDALGELGISATFFVVGRQVQAYPELVHRIVEEGHAIGTHSWSHPDPWRLSLRALTRDYRAGRHAAEAVLGFSVPLFRPPKGHLDLVGAAAISLVGLRPWLWTIDPGDWRPGVQSDELEAATSMIAGGDVVILHDAIQKPLGPNVHDRSATVAALPGISRLARRRGLTFQRISV